MSKPIIAAGIDIGSNSIKMLIAEVERPGELRVLEDVKLDSPIGDNTFTTGRIRSEAMFSVCRSLNQMSQLMKDYGVKHYRACATSGVREASNRLYFLEHIKQATPIQVELIDRSVERHLTYQALHYGLPAMSTFRNEGLLVVEIGSAGVQLSLYADGRLRFSEYVRIGILKINEVLDSLRSESLQFTNIVQQFIESQISLLLQRFDGLTIPHYLVLGGESSSIASKWGDEDSSIRMIGRESFLRHHRDIVQSGILKLAQQFRIGEERAEQIIPTSIIMSEFWKATQAEHVMLPDVSLRHGLLHQIAAERLGMMPDHNYTEDILAIAMNTASRYRLDLDHSLNVMLIAMKLFKACSRLFHLDASHALCLQLAAILHDVGKFIAQEGHEVNSYHILQSMDFLGLTDNQKDLIASMALYHPRGVQIPIRSDYTDEENLTLARLTSILKLANALDCSHRQQIKDIRVILKNGDRLSVKPVYEGSLELEAWAFMQESQLFEQISGYAIALER
ncbi:Ppx/GppA phosphatase family protein [Paenibacillus marinisediminis]